jgi:hypothetical protein
MKSPPTSLPSSRPTAYSGSEGANRGAAIAALQKDTLQLFLIREF